VTITLVRVEPRGTHATIWLWTDGGLSGQLTVRREDIDAMIDRLRPEKVEWRDDHASSD
jgi:hypothetical protein